jgi:Bardet-Biedl syndrome 5 protein
VRCAHFASDAGLPSFRRAASLSIRTANSRLRGNTQALYVTTRFQNNRFEFVFTSLIKQSPRLFTTAQAVHRAYDTSKLYRELKLRGAIIKDKQLLMLPEETVYSQVPGVWNLSSDQGNLGTFFVTNVRVVWFANMAENFNVSIPYLQMKDIKLRDSKFGPALVIETSQRSGGYILGFRVDPQSKLQTIFQEITRLYEVYSRTPVFGVQFQQEMAPPQSMAELKVDRPVDDVQVVDEGAFDALAVYFADQGRSRDREPVYSSELGLAVEKLPEGMTLDMLWKVST